MQGGGEAFLECRSVIRNLGRPAGAEEWTIKYAKGIPFVTDGVTKKWCMQVFQEGADNSISNVKTVPARVDLSNFDEDEPMKSSDRPPIADVKGVAGRAGSSRAFVAGHTGPT